jgi:hypothetical protein
MGNGKQWVLEGTKELDRLPLQAIKLIASLQLLGSKTAPHLKI